MQILVATSNKHKLEEIRRILKSPVASLESRVRETGRTFEENALKKAKAIAKKHKQLTIADDSGLMVNAMNGKPGIRSARYAVPPTAENLCNKLLKALKYKTNRRAKFVCAIAIVFPDGKQKIVKGIVHGKIIDEMRGMNGFGYDPVFIPDGFTKTFAEMRPSQKNKLSHRYLALLKAKKLLKI